MSATPELDLFPPLEAQLRERLADAQAEIELLQKTLQHIRGACPATLVELYASAVLDNRARAIHWRAVREAMQETRTTSSPHWIAVKVSALQLISLHCDGLP